MSSRKGKVAGDRVQQRREKGEKQRKNREEGVLYALKWGKKTESPTEKRKGGKRREEIERREFYML